MSEETRKDALINKFARANDIAKGLTREKIDEILGNRGNLTAFFESEDSSLNYDGRMPFDAFDRVLLCLGITPQSVAEYGIEATTLEKMWANEKARSLVPEVFGRAWRKVALGGADAVRALNTSQDATLGSFLNQYAFPASVRTPTLQAAIPLSELVAITTGISQTYYRPFYLEDVPQTEEIMARVSEGAEVPAVKISNSEKQISLKKTGRRIDVTYEALRQIPLDLLGYYVQRIAIKSEADKVNRVIDVLISGDGNAGTAATNYDLSDLDADAETGEPTIKSWLSFKMNFDNPFTLTHVFGRKDAILKLMMLNMGNANVPLVNAGTLFAAQQFTPINKGLADGVRAGWLNAVPADVILGIDGRVALERIFEIGGNIREVDRWIREQKESLVLTEMEGYAVNEPLAVKTLTLDE